MVATVSDLRGIVETTKSDTEVQTILDIAQKHIPSSATGNLLFLAHLYKSAVLLLSNMKTNGELPEQNKIGPVQALNKIDSMIRGYERMYETEMSKIALGNFTQSSYLISAKTLYIGGSR